MKELFISSNVESGTERKTVAADNVSSSRNEVTLYVGSALKERGTRKRKAPLVPDDLKRAGALYGDILSEEGVMKGDIEKLIDRSHGYINKFISGKMKDPDFHTLSRGLSYFVNRQEPRFIEIREIFQKREEQQLLQTIQYVGVTAGDGLRVIRMSEGLSQTQCGKEAGIDLAHYEVIESGKQTPSVASVNKLVDSHAIDPTGKLAQYLRLKTYREQGITRQELEACSASTLLQYMRITSGIETRRKLAQELYISLPLVQLLETTMPHRIQNYIKPIAQLLKVAEDDPIIDILRQKSLGQNVTVSEEMFASLMEGKLFLQAETSDTIAVTKKDRKLFSCIKNKIDFPEVVREIRQLKKITQRQLAQRVGVRGETINRIEGKRQLPHDYVAAEMMRELGHNVHDPLTWWAFYLLDKEKGKESNWKLALEKALPKKEYDALQF